MKLVSEVDQQQKFEEKKLHKNDFLSLTKI